MPAVQAFFDDMMERYLSSGLKNPVFEPQDIRPRLCRPRRDGTLLDLAESVLPASAGRAGFDDGLDLPQPTAIMTAYEEGLLDGNGEAVPNKWTGISHEGRDIGELPGG